MRRNKKGVFDYKTSEPPQQGEAYLDSNHTHFLLADNGTLYVSLKWVFCYNLKSKSTLAHDMTIYLLFSMDNIVWSPY